MVEDQSNPYRAPEARSRGLAGKIYGRPGFPDGKFVITSACVRSEGRRVWTRSGSEYLLEGPPDEGYMKFLNEQNIPLDLNDPFKKRAL